MTALQWINATVVLIGIPATIGSLLTVGRKLQLLDNLQITAGKIKTNVKVISDHLIRTSTDFDHSELQAYSPFKLTDKGKELIKKLGFDTVFKQHKEDFFVCIAQENPTKKYDIELAAIRSISILLSKDYMGFLKEFFYNNPERNLQNTAPTLGVYVRDKYLKEHPQIRN